MKEIIITYSDGNQKWYLFADGKLMGKYYYLKKEKLLKVKYDISI